MLFLSVTTLLGCYRGFQTYPTLDGEYILRSVTVNTSNVITSEVSDVTFDDNATIIFENPIGGLDTLKINKTRYHIDNSFLRTGYSIENGQESWKHEYPLSVRQDLITGRWIYLNVIYDTPYMNTIRRYVIIEDGMETLVLECPKRYEDGPEGYEYSCQLKFYRVDA